MPEYTIRVENRTGMQQNYAVFAEAPGVSQADRVWPVVYKTKSVSDGQEARFTLTDNFMLCTGSSQGRLSEGTRLNVSRTMRGKSGKFSFNEEYGGGDLRPGGSSGSMVIETESFNGRTVEQQNVFVGPALDDGEGGQAPILCFTPKPNSKHEISAPRAYYITTGSFQRGAIIEPGRSSLFKVELDKMQKKPETPDKAEMKLVQNSNREFMRS